MRPETKIILIVFLLCGICANSQVNIKDSRQEERTSKLEEYKNIIKENAVKLSKSDADLNEIALQYNYAEKLAKELNLDLKVVHAGQKTVKKLIDDRLALNYKRAKDMAKPIVQKKIYIPSKPSNDTEIEVKTKQIDTLQLSNAISAFTDEKVKDNKSLVLPDKWPFSTQVTIEGLISDTKELLNASKANTENHADNRLIKTTEDRINNFHDEFEARQLYDSIASVVTDISTIDEKTLFLYLRGTTNYTLGMLNQKLTLTERDSITKILQTTSSIIENKSSLKTPKIVYALSGFEKAISIYYITENDSVSYKHRLIAATLALQAAKANPKNVFYIRNLIFLLKEFQFVPNNLMSKNTMTQILRICCEAGDYLEKIDDDKVLIYKLSLDCIDYQPKNTSMYLKTMVKKINKIKKIYPYEGFSELLLAKSYNRQGFAHNSKQKKDEQKEDTKNASKALVNAIGKNVSSQLYMQELQQQFDNLNSNLSSLEQKQRIETYSDIINAIYDSNIDYTTVHNIAYIYTNSKASLANLYLLEKTPNDSIRALKNFKEAISVFEIAKLLKYYNNFSEDFSKYAAIYAKTIELELKNDNLPGAKFHYKGLIEFFNPVINEYRFDFYLLQSMVKASRIYGEYLYEKKWYREALKPLDFASIHGNKSATGKLIRLYQDNTSGMENKSRFDFYSNLYKFQSDIIKKITVDAQYGESIEPFDIYLVSRDPLYPYKGIDDQAQWLKIARGGIIPQNITSSIKDLQYIAWENGVSYVDLCTYALTPVNEEFSIKKYAEAQQHIEAEKGNDEKMALYKKLELQLQEDLKNERNEKLRERIKSDNVIFYNFYGKFLADNSKPKEAIKIFDKLLNLDPVNDEALDGKTKINYELNKKSPELLANTKNVLELSIYLTLYLKNNNKNYADLIKNKMLALDDTPKMRYFLYQQYQASGVSNFKTLFLLSANKSENNELRDYYLKQYVPNDKIEQRKYYQNLIELDKKYASFNRNDEKIKKEFAEHYYKLLWYSMLSQTNEKNMNYIKEAQELDSSNKFYLAYLPFVYLFEGNIEKAKQLFLEYKNVSINEISLKDKYLIDIKSFEDAGITNVEFNEIKLLLR